LARTSLYRGQLDHCVDRRTDIEDRGGLYEADDMGRTAIEALADELRVGLGDRQRSVLVLPPGVLRQLAEDRASVEWVAPRVLPEATRSLGRHVDTERGSQRRDVRGRERPDRQHAAGGPRCELAPTLRQRLLGRSAHNQQDQGTTCHQPAGGEQEGAKRFGVDEVRVVDDDDARLVFGI
jgi:hypothetical protein